MWSVMTVCRLCSWKYFDVDIFNPNSFSFCFWYSTLVDYAASKGIRYGY